MDLRPACHRLFACSVSAPLRRGLGVCALALLVGAPLLAADAPATAGPPAAPAITPLVRPTNPTSGPITRGQQIFAVHHSFHQGGFYDVLAAISESAGITGSLMLGNFYIGGSTVIQHWNGPSGKAAQAALTAGTVDVLTTTPIYLPDAGIENFATLGHQHNPNFRMTVMEFWLPFDNYEPGNYIRGPGRVEPPKQVDHNAATGDKLRAMHEPYFMAMDQQIRDLNTKLGAPVVLAVPVGQAVIALREKIAAGQVPKLKAQWDLFTDPLGHPKPALTVLMAYCHYAVIYRQNPIGLPAPKVLGEDAAGLNRLLQELAWDAVSHQPLSGVVVAPAAAAP